MTNIARRTVLGLLCAIPLSSMADSPGRTILVFGDSIGAGFGVTGATWVQMLRDRLKDRGIAVVNESKSGETTAGGLARLPAALAKHSPVAILIELGTNDALRGLPLNDASDNLRSMIRQAKRAGAKPLLVGMKVSTAYGPARTTEMVQMYRDVAASEQVPLLPYLLEGMGSRPGAERYMQADRLHPNDTAQQGMVENVWPEVLKLVEQ